MSLITCEQPFGELIPISLDTSNIIDLKQDLIPNWYPIFEQIKKSRRFTFCLSDLAVGELVKEIYEIGFDFMRLQVALKRDTSLIDEVVPILPGGVDMEKLCGMNIHRETSKHTVDEIIQRSRMLWKKLSEADQTREIAGEEEIEALKKDLGQLKTAYQQTFTSPENTARELGLDLGSLPYDKKAQIKLSEGFRKKFQIYKARNFTVDQVMDLYIHLRIQLFIDFTRVDGYNPMKNKDNHPYDLLLFEALPLPALVLVDKNMYNKVQQTSSYQKKWVYTADTLANAFQSGQLDNLKLKFQ